MIHFIITGDALSAGTEMMDSKAFPNYNLLLKQFLGMELNERRIYRWRLQAQWGLKHFKTAAQRKSLDDGNLSVVGMLHTPTTIKTTTSCIALRSLNDDSQVININATKQKYTLLQNI